MSIGETSTGQIADWDDAYANIAHIPGGAEFPDAWAQAAADFRERHPATLWTGGQPPAAAAAFLAENGPPDRFPGALKPRDIYAPKNLPAPDAEFYLPQGEPRGLAVFVHGGYWMKFAPSWFSHLAQGALARGWAVLLPSYPLAPAAGLPEMRDRIAAQVAAAAGEVSGPIALTGHSAGGHLAARLVCKDSPLPAPVLARVARCLPISGLFDLRPLQLTAMRGDLGLDDATARDESPLFHLPVPGCELHLWVGGDERPVFIRQSQLLHAAWAGFPRRSTLTVEPGRHHLDVVAGLAAPDHPLTEALLGGL